jgi:ribosome-binding factor A
MAGFRRERANSFILQELTLALDQQVKDPRARSLSITEVDLTPDRRVARVYVTAYTGEEDLKEGLEGLRSARGVLRRHLSQVLGWRWTPYLEFRADRSWEYGARMDALFREISHEDSDRGEEADAAGPGGDDESAT